MNVKRPENGFLETSLFHQQIINSAQNGIIVYGTDMRYQLWNPYMERLSGLSSSDVVGKHPLEVFPLLGNSGLMEYIERALAGEPTDPVDFPYPAEPGGKKGWASESLAPLRNSNGEVTGAIGVVIDITARKSAEEALRKNEERSRAVSDLVTDYIFRVKVTPEGKLFLQEVIGNLHEATGRTLDEARTLESWTSIFHPDDLQKAMQFMGNVVKEKAPGELEVRTITKSGAMRWVRIFARPVLDEETQALAEVIGAVKDISDRKRAEEAVRDSEYLVKSINDNLVNGMIYQVIRKKDRTRKFTYLSDKVKEFYGITPKEGMEDAGLVYGRIHQDDRERVFREEERANEGMSVFETETRIIRPDGKIRWSYFVSHPRMLDDETTCWDGIELDISDRKRIEEKLLISEERYRTIMDSSPDAITITDLSGTILECSAATAKMHGFSCRDELIGLPSLSYFHPDERERADEGIKRILRERTPQNKEYTLFKKDGTAFPVEISASVVCDNSGEPVAFMSVAKDITERKKAEAALRESESKYRGIVDTANEGISLLGPDHVVTFVNNRLCEMMGYRPEEIIGGDFESFLFEEDIPDHRATQAMRKAGVSGRYERRIKRRDGGALWTIISGAPIFDEEGNFQGAMGMFTDITEWKLAEQKKEELQRQLLQAQKMEAIGQLAGGIAHDFNNILAVIIGTAEMNLRHLDQEDPMSPRMQRIIKVANRAKDLTMKLLTFARKEKVDMRNISVDSLIVELSDMLKRSIPEKIRIETRLGEPHSHLLVDFNQMLQALLNICINSSDAMPGGGLLSIESRAAGLDEEACHARPGLRPGDYCLIEIRDTGHGFDPQIREKIFEPFFTTKDKGKGTGLGLAVTLGIIQSHGGYLEIDSGIGAGTVAKIYLPVADTNLLSPEEQLEKYENIKSGRTILVVDDDNDFLGMVSELLNMNGFKTICTESGEKALEIYKAQKGRIDLVLLDMIMPDMDGNDVFHEIKKFDPGVKAVLCSGYSIDEKARGIIAEGIDGYLQKPFESKNLLRVISQILPE